MARVDRQGVILMQTNTLFSDHSLQTMYLNVHKHSMLYTWYSNRNVTQVKILKIHYTFVRTELILHVDM